MSAPAAPPGVPWRRHLLWACLAVLYAACIFLLSEIPGTRLARFGFRHTLANLCHVPLYAGFAAFVLMAFVGTLAGVRRGRWPTLYTLAAVMTYAITDELHQRFVPGRFASPGDLVLDFLGASIALGAMHLAARRARGPRRGALAGRAGSASPALLLALAVGAITLAVYLPALRGGFTNWDDPIYVLEDQAIRSLSPAALVEQARAVRVGIWAPITTFSYALDFSAWGLEPFGYHLTNVLLHALSAGLLVALLLELGFAPGAAALAAAIFALHPAQVEAVAWISQRKSVLAVFFLLLSFLAYVRGTRASPPARGAMALSFSLFLAALLSKVSVVIFPAVLILYDLGYRRERLRRLLLEKMPFLAAAALVAWIGYRLQAASEVTTPGWLGGTPALHAATTAGLLARYVRILLFPTNLSTLYDPPDAATMIDSWALAGYAFLAIGAIAAREAWQGNRQGNRRGDRRALWWMGIFWLGFLPVSQIVTFSVHMADRYLYVPSIGYAAGAGAGLAGLLARCRGRALRGAAVAAAGIALAFLAALTSTRTHVWRDPISLWGAAVRREPVHPMSDYNYARTLSEQGDLRGAIPYYERALGRTDSIQVIVNLGNVYALLGDLDRAEALLRRAASSPRARPAARALAATNLGVILEKHGAPESAASAYRRAILLAPEDPRPRVLLGRRLRAMGRPAHARARFEQVLARDPGNAEAAIGLAGLDADAGKYEAARKRLDALLAREPNLPEALLERARAHAGEGNAAAARADLARALDLAPPGEIRKRIVEARDALDGRASVVPER